MQISVFRQALFLDFPEVSKPCFDGVASLLRTIVTTQICINNISANKILAVKPGLCVGKKKFVWQEFVDCYLLNTKVKLKKCLAYGCAVLKKQKNSRPTIFFAMNKLGLTMHFS